MVKTYSTRKRPISAGVEYWDTTVFLDLLHDKGNPRGIVAGALWQDAKNNGRAICTSHITIVEVAYITHQNVKALTAEEEAKIEAMWFADDSPVRFIAVDVKVVRDAREIKRKCLAQDPSIPMEAPDAIHLACAQKAGVPRFLTTDQFNKKKRKISDAKGRNVFELYEIADQRQTLSKLCGLTICAPEAKGLLGHTGLSSPITEQASESGPESSAAT
jgi:predicted nucleic acid-binding protein